MNALLVCSISFQLSNGDTVTIEKGTEIIVDVTQGVGFNGDLYFDIQPQEYRLSC